MAGKTRPRGKDESLEQWVGSLPTLVLSSNTITADISEAVKRGLLRKVGPRLYATDLRAPVEALVRGYAVAIAALRAPGCVLSHRTALEMIAAQGHLFLTGPKNQTIHLPGLTLKVKQGQGPLVGDMPVMDLFVSSPARAYLENLDYTRRSMGVCRALGREQIEERLERDLRLKGEAWLGDMRDQARELAPVLGMDAGLATLDEIVGAMLGTRASGVSAPVAVARQRGRPYDPDRVVLFQRLAEELLERWGETRRPRAPLLRHESQHLAFIDAYFSNYIEGTVFELEEAKDIVFEGKVPDNRPQDAHDITGTFELLVDPTEMGVSMSLFDEVEDFEHVLQRRHYTIMRARPEARPGAFKQVSNQAGNTLFVAPELVRGTLAEGLRIFKTLHTPFQRATFMMFVVAEVHPFVDGNGRLARAMMNAEVASAEEDRILIVTSYRTDYLGALRRLSRSSDPAVVPRMLDRAQELASRLDYEDLERLIRVLTTCNAFDDTDLRIMRLPPKPAR
ncbi:Fic family protein [Paraliomyxa miuraensis]|uniref:Fic family protein n=1 Tax=Paraliomyxa miuraensis TaxID=376150 RepID=UPI0022552E90|nr:Fic family protein [Paraliomyxa miuraensis]MCX4247492.1 Fic family protein [Paraliomyxa miuraensis]